MDTFNNIKKYLELIEKYKIIAENIDECIWLFNLSSKRYEYISPSISKIRGLSSKCAIKQRAEDRFTPEALKKMKIQFSKRLSSFLAGDRSKNIISCIDEYEQYCKDGTIKKVEISTKLILNQKTNIIYILGVSRNISYRENPTNNGYELLSIDNGHIYCFGKLLVYGVNSNCPVKWRTKKSEELFAYLLQNRKQEISKWKICDILWPECSSDKINNRLHTTIYKMKQTLISANIKFNIKFINGCYWFNTSDAYVDIIEFDSILNSDIVITENTIEKYKKAFSLYKNRYLEGNDFVWSFSQKELYSSKYRKLVKHLIDFYIKKNNYVEVEKIVLKVLEICPLDEYTNEIYLKLCFIKKDKISFTNHYKLLQNLYKNELGIEPSINIKNLYNSIMNSWH